MRKLGRFFRWLFIREPDEHFVSWLIHCPGFLLVFVALQSYAFNLMYEGTNHDIIPLLKSWLVEFFVVAMWIVKVLHFNRMSR